MLIEDYLIIEILIKMLNIGFECLKMESCDWKYLEYYATKEWQRFKENSTTVLFD